MEDLPPLKDVIKRFDLNAKKSLGQNFLFDLNLTRKIARYAGPLDGVCVLEIGPGPGGLTRALLMEGAAHVVALEKDARCLPALAEVSAFFDHKLSVYEADALEFDMSDLAHKPTRIVANLPYNVGTKLLTQWLELNPWPNFFDRLVLMFQREVAERIVAKVGDDAYGRLGVLVGWRANARILFDINRSAFSPPPNVTSSVVEITPKVLVGAQPNVKTMSLITQAAFGQRRKMLRQSLKGVFASPEQVLIELGIAPTARAEELSVEQFVSLALFYENSKH